MTREVKESEKHLTPEQRYNKKMGMKLKSFRIDIELEKQFNEKCDNNSIGRSEAIEDLINMFVKGDLELKRTRKKTMLTQELEKIK